MTVRDDDGGEGVATGSVTVIEPTASHNADLSNLLFEGGVLGIHQNQPPTYTADGFTPACTDYTVSGAVIIGVHVTATASDHRAILEVYCPTHDTWEPLASGVSTVVEYRNSPNYDIRIRVTAEDGVTTKTYTVV